MDSSVSLFRQMCDDYYDAHKFGALGTTTHVNIVNNEFGVNDMAKMTLALYNEKEEQNFNLKKVLKLNTVCAYYCMTFEAQDNQTYKCHLFRGVVSFIGGCNALLCEIKDDNKIKTHGDHEDNFVKNLSNSTDDPPSNAGSSKNNLGAHSVICPSGQDLVSSTVQRVMREKSLAYRRLMHANSIDPDLYEDYGTVTVAGVDCFACARKYAVLAINSFNKINLTNFKVKKIEKLNVIFASCYGMTFWARNPRSNNFCTLFRGVVHFKTENEVAGVDDYVLNLNESENYLSNTCSESDLGDGCAAGSHGAILVHPAVLGMMGESSISRLYALRADYMDPWMYEDCGLTTVADVDCFDGIRQYVEVALYSYNKEKQKNFKLLKVEELNLISASCYYMNFWAQNGRYDECRLFQGSICIKNKDEDDTCVQIMNKSDRLPQ